MIDTRQSPFHAHSIRLLVGAGFLIVVWIVVLSITGTQMHFGGSQAEAPTHTSSLHIPHIHLPLDHHEPPEPESTVESTKGAEIVSIQEHQIPEPPEEETDDEDSADEDATDNEGDKQKAGRARRKRSGRTRRG
jgi:hypothetical protein